MGNAKIHGLHIVDNLPTLAAGHNEAQMSGFDFPQYEAELRKAASRSLEQTVAEHIPDEIDVETRIEKGVPKNIIADYAKQHGIDLIVMSTHGRSGLPRMMLGSVAEATIRTATVPVLTIPVEE